MRGPTSSGPPHPHVEPSLTGSRPMSQQRPRSSSQVRCWRIRGESAKRSLMSSRESTAPDSAGTGVCCTRSTTPSTWSSCSTFVPAQAPIAPADARCSFPQREIRDRALTGHRRRWHNGTVASVRRIADRSATGSHSDDGRVEVSGSPHRGRPMVRQLRPDHPYSPPDRRSTGVELAFMVPRPGPASRMTDPSAFDQISG